ncbi:MAG TPA: hypothetical protein V6D25_03145 [Leptolyngbyaceae cyanobacterium]
MAFSLSGKGGDYVDSAKIKLFTIVWNVTDGHLLQKFKDHKNWVWSVKFSPPDGHKLASASDDKTVKIWDVKTGEHLKTLTELLEEEQSHDDWVRCVAFDKDGLLLASGSNDG